MVSHEIFARDVLNATQQEPFYHDCSGYKIFYVTLTAMISAQDSKKQKKSEKFKITTWKSLKAVLIMKNWSSWIKN